MKRCLTLAKNGLGKTYPNPLVGSVIVYKDRVIGEGWHKKAGEAHAEVNAINSVKDKSLLPHSTIYVNLEPCSHWGRTPPCADLIVKKQIKNIVIGSIDFNKEVDGKGVLHLQKNGCDVKVGVLEQECKEVNKRFFTFHQKKRPYIVLKWAETKDKFIFPYLNSDLDSQNKNNDDKKPVWISNSYSLQLVHKWRTEEQAILVGTNTVLNDNPKLDARDYFGNSPVRIAIDKNLKVPNDFHFYDNSIESLIITEKRNKLNVGNTFFEQIDFSKSIVDQILDILYKRGEQSVIIEGGAQTLQSFIDKDLWDEARAFEGDIYFRKGIRSPELKGVIVKNRSILNDKLTIYRNG